MGELNILEIAVTILCTMLASSGFWLWIQKRGEKKDCKTKLLMGLASYRIVTSGMEYINRGWVTKDEYEMLNDSLFSPYKEMGGNGTAARIMCAVEKLPFREIKKMPTEEACK